MKTTVNEAEQLLRSLVHKIDSERGRGTPVHPKGHPDCEWNEYYPAQLTAARDFIKELDFQMTLLADLIK